jgi:hypothetical protein
MEINFACDAATELAKSQLKEWAQHSGFKHLALVDMALLSPDQRSRIMADDQWHPANGFEETALAAFGEYAPHLIPLSENPLHRSGQIDRLLDITQNIPAVSWVRSNSAEAALRGLFGYLGKAQMEQPRRPVHLRFADVRILGVLLTQLTLAQHARLSRNLESWGWIDRCGAWQECQIDADSSDVADPDPAPYIHLSKHATRVISEAAEADIFFAQLDEKRLPDLECGSRFHTRLVNCLNTATALQLSSKADRFQFVLLCLEYGDDFHSCEQLRPTWECIRESERGLLELANEWPEDLWMELERLAESKKITA